MRFLLDLTKRRSETQVQFSYFFSTREALTGEKYEQCGMCSYETFISSLRSCILTTWLQVSTVECWPFSALEPLTCPSFIPGCRKIILLRDRSCLSWRLVGRQPMGFCPLSASTLCSDWTKREKKARSKVRQKAGAAE